MRLQRLVVGLLGAALLGAVPVALTATSAEAGTTALQTRIKLDKTAKVYKYGQKTVIAGNVQAYSPGDGCASTSWCTVPDGTGTVTLKVRKAGSTKWKTVDSRTNESDFSFTRTSTGSVVYRVVYTGGTWDTYSFQSSTKDRTAKGSRHPHSKGVKSGGRLYYRGNVDPGWGRKPVTIQKKNCKSCGWHGYKTVRTSRTGGYSARVYAPSSGRWYFRSVVRATKPRFVKATGGVIYTYRLRAAARGAGAGIGG
jgi:hypothetical protein